MMIKSVSLSQSNLTFGANINLDSVCRGYYKTSPAFRETIETIKRSVVNDVDVFAGEVSKAGNRFIYGRNVHNDGVICDVKIGETHASTHGMASLDKFVSAFKGDSFINTPEEYFKYILEKKFPNFS